MPNQRAGRKPLADAQAPRDRTITTGRVKKPIWFHPDEAEALRGKAFKECRSEAAIVRAALWRLLGIED